MQVKAKKYLGQHFLTDETTALKIVESMDYNNNTIIEIGAGMGVLTKYIIEKTDNLYIIEIDKESVEYLLLKYKKLNNKIFETDFLKYDLNMFKDKISIIGNFPYNISTQIIFKVIENRNLITEVVGMFQKEVAERLASKEGNKHYGIPSVLLQAYYDVEYLFSVSENVFNPPPKVKSAVIRLRKKSIEPDVDYNKMSYLVKKAFGLRRKKLSNSIKELLVDKNIEKKILDSRPEQLSVNDFIELTKIIFAS